MFTLIKRMLIITFCSCAFIRADFPTIGKIPVYYDGESWHEISINSTDDADTVTYNDPRCPGEYYNGSGYLKKNPYSISGNLYHYSYSDNRGNQLTFDVLPIPSVSGDFDPNNYLNNLFPSLLQKDENAPLVRQMRRAYRIQKLNAFLNSIFINLIETFEVNICRKLSVHEQFGNN